MRRAPGRVTSTPWGSYLYLCLPRPNGDQPTGRGEIHPWLPGEGVLMRYSSRPSDCCKGQSEPIAENSSDAPPRYGPLAPEDRARRLAELRAVLSAPAFQARMRAGEQGGLTP